MTKFNVRIAFEDEISSALSTRAGEEGVWIAKGSRFDAVGSGKTQEEAEQNAAEAIALGVIAQARHSPLLEGGDGKPDGASFHLVAEAPLSHCGHRCSVGHGNDACWACPECRG